MKNLAPSIYRQRLVIEGTCKYSISSDEIKLYLKRLSDVLGMKSLNEPVTHRSEKYGWAGWIHWESSGTHFYAWEQPMIFFSIDIYTCKKINVDDAVVFTRAFFETTELVFKEF